MRRNRLVVGLIVLLAGCATVPTEPRPERATADAAFPAPGSRWITRSSDQSGRTWTTTWNVLEEGSYQGESVYRVSDQLNTLVYDKATRNWMATLQWDEERFAASPHNGVFAWPLQVGKWWVSTFAYHDQGREGASPRVLALGNPDLGPALALRYAEREARAVGERYPGTTVLVRESATEAMVKALSPSVGLLHFATHGELNEQDPLSSALLLVPDGPEDGRLEVRELFGLDLHARLVVLSACETGLGKLSKGDELVGLQRAFLYAGTPAVVTTLWKVDDRSSFLLMREFYDRLKTRGPAEALGQAQRETMKEFPHPFAWAAFGLTGAPR